MVLFTLALAGVSTLLTLLLGLPAAWVFARFEFPVKRAARALTVVPFVLPTVVVGSAFLALLGPRSPLNALRYGSLRRGLPAGPPRWLGGSHRHRPRLLQPRRHHPARGRHVGPYRPAGRGGGADAGGVALARLPRGDLAAAAAGRHHRRLDRLPLHRDLFRRGAAVGRPARHHPGGGDLPPDGHPAGPAHGGGADHPPDGRRLRPAARQCAGAGAAGRAAAAARLERDTAPAPPGS